MKKSIWSGQLSVAGLVSVEVGLYGLIEPTDHRARLCLYDPATGGKVKQVYVTADGRQVDKAELSRAYPINKDAMIEITPAELDRLQSQTRDPKAIIIDRLCSRADIPECYYTDRCYAALPRGSVALQSTYWGLVKALGRRVGIGRMTLSKREMPVALRVDSDGTRDYLALYKLQFHSAMRSASQLLDEVLGDASQDARGSTAIRQILASCREGFQPERYVNRFDVALRELIQAKLAKSETVSAEPSKAEVTDLMAKLRTAANKAKKKGAI